MSQDRKWYQFEAKNPPDGVRLFLKMADKNDNISYAIGIVDQGTGKLRLLAEENKEATLAVYWLLPPD